MKRKIENVVNETVKGSWSVSTAKVQAQPDGSIFVLLFRNETESWSDGSREDFVQVRRRVQKALAQQFPTLTIPVHTELVGEVSE